MIKKSVIAQKIFRRKLLPRQALHRLTSKLVQYINKWFVIRN